MERCEDQMIDRHERCDRSVGSTLSERDAVKRDAKGKLKGDVEGTFHLQ